jgi:hypothetical protein
MYDKHKVRNTFGARGKEFPPNKGISNPNPINLAITK